MPRRSIGKGPDTPRPASDGPTDGTAAAVRTVEAAAARRFLVRRHGLAPPRSLPAGPDGVMQAFAVLGSIQFDPLMVAGRNHDLVLHARVADYDPAWTEHLLYERRSLYETINKMLSLLPTAELPWYRHAWDRSAAYHEAGAFERHAGTIEHVIGRISAAGPMSSRDFDRRQAVDWYWGPTNEVRAVLEALWEAGVLGLARREGNLRFYDLAERIYPPELLAHRPSPREQMRHKLLSRYRAVGLLGTGGESALWYGTGRARRGAGDPPEAIIRAELRDELVAAGELVPVRVEGLRGPRFVVSGELPLLEAVAEGRDGELAPGATLLAPLDPLAWDRDLLRDLFGFDYVWEVYVPAAKRRWGYYVLPLLVGDRFVGRIEPRIDRAAGTVRILGLWWEPGIDPDSEPGLVDAVRAALAAYLRFGRASRIEWDPALSRERRRFGTRPRDRAAPD